MWRGFACRVAFVIASCAIRSKLLSVRMGNARASPVIFTSTGAPFSTLPIAAAKAVGRVRFSITCERSSQTERRTSPWLWEIIVLAICNIGDGHFRRTGHGCGRQFELYAHPGQLLFQAVVKFAGDSHALLENRLTLNFFADGFGLNSYLPF